jgi:hypothetical protein
MDVPVQLTGQPLLADQIDIGGGILVYQLKVGLGGGGGGAVNQGTPGPCDSPWPMVLTEDGTNVCVKPGDNANKAVRVNVVAGGSGFSGGFTDHSGVTPDAASHVVAAANASRHYLMIQNISDDTLWVNFGVAAVLTQPSIRLRAGAVYIMESSFINTASVNLIGAAGLAYVVKEG